MQSARGHLSPRGLRSGFRAASGTLSLTFRSLAGLSLILTLLGAGASSSRAQSASNAGVGPGRAMSDDTGRRLPGFLTPWRKDPEVQREQRENFGDLWLRTRYMGSSYVPVDSWVYPAFERLAALGYTTTEALTIRPWTRVQCALLLAEVHEALDQDDDTSVERGAIAGDLDREFAPETALLARGKNFGASVESIYSRSTEIAGTPLRDSVHFAQTISDDFGRPYGQGFNTVDGLSARAEAGPLAFYVRGEYQQAAGIPGYSLATQQAIANIDGLPFGEAAVFHPIHRPRPVEAYVALNLDNWQLSFGQQSLWWGPVRSTGLLMSNNAEAMPMLRLDRTTPYYLPGPLAIIGPIRFDAFLARQGGIDFLRLGPTFVLTGHVNHSINPPPYIWGAFMSFKPTVNLEFGAGVTTVFAGLGRPLTLGTFLHTFSSNGNLQAVDPGDRRTEANFTYRLPFLRSWAALYAEGFAEDEPIPFVYPRSAYAPGLYFPRLPKLHQVEFRTEGVYTNLPHMTPQVYFYTNEHYANGYTNYRQIIGSWIGPQGIGWQGSTTYHVATRKTVTATYRRMYTDPGQLGGGNNNDFTGAVDWLVRPDLAVAANVQYERWNFKQLAASPQSDVSATIEVRFYPTLTLGRDR